VERIDKKFHDRAPHTEKGYQGREGEFFVCENIVPVGVAGFFGSGKSAEELPAHSKRGFDAAPKSVWDPAERLKEQDRDGVSAEILYTSMGMLLYGLDDAELRAACFHAFNDWASEYCSYNPKRLVGLGSVTLEDIPAAVAELKRCAQKGVTLPLLPSEYIKRQVYATFQFETVGNDLVEAYSADRMMWSSDYPHTDSPWPHSQEYIEGSAFRRITPTQTQKIVADNAARFYQIELN